MEKKITSNIKVEDAKIIFRNFTGAGSEFNKEGERNFGLLLPDDMAEELIGDGWNVKRLKPHPDAEDPEYRQPWLPVKVKFGKIPPVAVMITSRGKIRLDEETIGQLDWANIENVDLIVRPYNYPAAMGRPAGISAYLKSIYVTIREDDLDKKYADIDFVGGE